MSLITWFPLNGNLKNYGASNVELKNHNALISSDGKIGKCYQFNDNSAQQYLYTDNVINKDTFSISMWVYSTSSTQTQTLFCSRKTVGLGIAFFLLNGVVRIDCGIKNTTDQWNTGYNYPINTWFHLTVTNNNGIVSYYINGELKATKIISSYNLDTLGNYITIGESHGTDTYLANGNFFLGKLNDIRIYDNCISKREIKDIYNTCILHYTFNNGYGNENLLSGCNDVSYWIVDNCNKESYVDEENGQCIKITSLEDNCRIYHNLSDVWTILGSDFTISFYAKSTEDGTVIDMSRSLQDFSENVTLTTEWKKYSIHIKLTDISNTGTLSIRIHTANKIIYIKDIKLEKGLKASNWCPNKEDALFKEMGYNNGIEYDITGLGNNGKISNTVLTHVFDSPRYYDSSLFVSANKDYIDIETFVLKKQSTINFWAKFTTLEPYSRFFEFCNALSGATGNYRILFGINNVKNLIVHIYDGQDGTTSLLVRTLTNVGEIDTKWHMYTFILNEKKIAIYMDNNKVLDATLANPISEIERKYCYIGKSSYSGDSYFNGQISDFRIFNQPISDSYIDYLFNSGVCTDKNGNLFSNEFIESTNNKNLFDTYQYPASIWNYNGKFIGELVDCSDSITRKATKITCTTEGRGFYINGHGVFDKIHLKNGKQYIVSMYVKSDTRTNVKFNIECTTKQSKTLFTINNSYRRICIIFTYSNTTAYSSFTCYSDFLLDENLYIHSFKVEEYNPVQKIEKKNIIESNSFIEINNEKKCKIYKQDIQVNELIEN